MNNQLFVISTIYMDFILTFPISYWQPRSKAVKSREIVFHTCSVLLDSLYDTMTETILTKKRSEYRNGLYSRLIAKSIENCPMILHTTRSEALMGGKDAKGRCSVLNVTQPRRKARLQHVHSTGLESSALYRCRFKMHYYWRDIATTRAS